MSAAPTTVPTRIPPPNLNPSAAPGSGGGDRTTVVNTDGQGANMRAEPSPDGTLVQTVREGTELEVIGAEREGGGRTWRHVRNPEGGASGWIVVELLSPVTSAPEPAAESKPAGEPAPAAEPKPSGNPAPPGSPASGTAPASPSVPAGAARPATRIGEADRAYLSILQVQVDVLGKGITAANEQIERTGGRPDTVSDPAWRQDTQAVADSLRDAAAKIRAANPGPNTGEVHRYASNAADRADEVADGLTAAMESEDARGLSGVRTTLVRLLAEINNMNLTLLDLQ